MRSNTPVTHPYREIILVVAQPIIALSPYHYAQIEKNRHRENQDSGKVALMKCLLPRNNPLRRVAALRVIFCLVRRPEASPPPVTDSDVHRNCLPVLVQGLL